MQIPLINEHLVCEYFVRLSVGNATKALLLMDVFILVLFMTVIDLSREENSNIVNLHQGYLLKTDDAYTT